MGWRHHHCIKFSVFLIYILSLSSAQDDLKPTLPDVFQTEVQGFFIDNMMILDGSFYYDRKNNRAAVSYTYQKETTKRIYNFNDDELVIIQENECTVIPIPDDPGYSFSPFTTDKETGKKIIGSPEDVLYFKNSTLVKDGFSVFPSYVYEAKLNFPLYRDNCTVRHVFTMPKVDQPDCDSHDCQPTLLTIIVNCPAFVKEETEDDAGGTVEAIEHTYDFYRFKPYILDEGVFQPPAGMYCNLTNHKIFPGLPDYFSFSYDFQEDAKDYLANSGILSTHKKVWYDSKLRLIRVDEFEENGMLISSRIFDFYSETAYTIVTNLADCETGAIENAIDLSVLTRLPKLFFRKNLTTSDAVYIGKKKAHGLSYDVWSASMYNTETDSLRVEEFFYRTVLDGAKSQGEISHVDVYMYGRDPDAASFELSVNAYYSINNFRSNPKEWEAFDVSICFENDRRKAFRLKVTGPPIVKHSFAYEDLLERLYMKLIDSTSVSVIRISELSGVHDGTHLTEFNGWILDKTTSSDSKIYTSEPEMHKAYELLKTAASSGSLNIRFMKLEEEMQYNITLIEYADNTKSKDVIPNWITAILVITLVAGVSAVGAGGYYVYQKRRHDSTASHVKMEQLR